MKVLAPAKVIVISLHLAGWHLFDFSLLLFRRDNAQGSSYVSGDFILNFKNIFRFAVIPLGPSGASGASFCKLSGDPQSISSAPSRERAISGVPFLFHPVQN
jgi:hypothetical protein